MKLDFQKDQVAKGKSAFFVTGPFSTPHSICLREILS